MERKGITNVAKLLLCIWNIGLFALIWWFYYNRFAFDTFLVQGAVVSCIIFSIIYLALCNLYKAFRIASTQIMDTVLGQFISFGLAELILYVECCLLNNYYVSVIPGAVVVGLQLLGTLLIVTFAKRYFMKYVPARKTLLLYGEKRGKDDADIFYMNLMRKYDHLFNVEYMHSEEDKTEEVIEHIEDCDIVLLYELSREMRSKYVKICTELHKKLYFTPKIEDIMFQGSSPKNLLDTPLMKYDYGYDSISGYVGKRALDIVLALLCLVLFSPFMLVAAIAIKLQDGGPVFFKQKRCTKDGKVFEILKFRSMIVDAEKDGVQPCMGEADSRITKVGKFIRATRIDELPQLINILMGDMSFVGPRPERVEHVEEYSKELPEFAYRLRVVGGLTGYAQIYGKYNTSAYDKLRLDLMYIENQSLWLDIKLILMTIKTVFQRESTEGFTEEKSQKMNIKTKAQVCVENENVS